MSEYKEMVKEVDRKIDNDAVTKFMDRVKKDADSLCIDFCLVTEGGRMTYSDHWAMSALGKDQKDPDVVKAVEAWRNSKDTKSFTFKDLFELSQRVKRDEFGYFEPFPNYEIFPKYYLHIYNSKLQVNLCVKNGNDDADIAIGDFVFYPEENEVCPVRVVNGVADYDCMKRLPWDTEITKNGLEPYMYNAGLISGVLRDIIGSYM